MRHGGGAGFSFFAAFPFFNNVDERRHFDLAATAIAIAITVAEFFANGVAFASAYNWLHM